MELAAERVLEEESDDKATVERMEALKTKALSKTDNSILWG